MWSFSGPLLLSREWPDAASQTSQFYWGLFHSGEVYFESGSISWGSSKARLAMLGIDCIRFCFHQTQNNLSLQQCSFSLALLSCLLLE